MEDTYVYISVKLYLKDGQTEDSIQQIIQNLDYSFDHEDIMEHEIIDTLDFQIPEKDEPFINTDFVDPFDISNIGFLS